MRKLRLLLLASLLVVSGLFAPPLAYAVDDAASGEACEVLEIGGGTCSTDRPQAQGVLGGLMGSVVSILIWVVGVVAVIVLLLGAYRYTTSGGDANKLKGAKDTIIYALIGIAVAVLAAVIVNFAVSASNEPPPEPETPPRTPIFRS